MSETPLAQLLVDQSPDAIIFAGKDGTVQLWNQAAAAMFGYSREEALGKRLDIIIPEQFREAHWAGFDKAISTGVTKLHGEALPTRAMKASGDNFYIEVCFALVRDDSGAVIGALANARDINERFQQDRANRRRLRELEAQVKESAAG
jgi:PAS domain S-box-containing protein